MQPSSKRTVITDDGVRIAYDASGPPTGPVIVLCHGLCASGRQFEADARYFATRGYRVIVPDFRAHGASGAPEGEEADFSIARLAADLRLVLDDAGANHVHWLGNSLGGIVGLAMLADTPARFASLATFGTAYRLTLPGIAPPVLPLLYKLFGPKRLGRVAAAVTTEDPAARELIADTIAAFDPQAGLRIAEQVRSYDFTAAAQAYRGPILLMRCGRDRGVNLALGPTLEAMGDSPNFQRIDLPEAGHCANLDAPGDVRSALEQFWQRAGAEPVRSQNFFTVDV